MAGMGGLGESDALIKVALDALKDDPDEALRKAEEALRSAGADRARSAKARRAASCAHLQLGDAQAAASAAEEALAAFRELRDVPGEASALRALVEARLFDGRVDAADTVVSDALQRFQTAQDAKGEAFALLLKADVMTAQEDYDGAASRAEQALAAFRRVAAKDVPMSFFLLRLSEFYLTSAWKPAEASSTAEEALKLFRGLAASEPGRAAGEGAALQASSAAHAAEQRYDAALTAVNDALAIFANLGDRAAQDAAIRAKVNIYLGDRKKTEARSVAKEAVAMYRSAADAKCEAGAQLLVAEVCIQTLQNSEAIAAAKAALELYKSLGSRPGQAAALMAIATADADGEAGESVSAASERAALFRAAGDRYREAESLLMLANAHVARIAKKIARCTLAPVEDSLAALRASKDAHALFAATGYSDGMEGSLRAVAQVLRYNNVAPEVAASVADPEEVYQQVMAGQFSNSKNALPQRETVPKSAKIEEIIPSAKQLDRGKFAWNNPLAGYSYTLIWQPTKDRRTTRQKPRGSYNVLALNNGGRTAAVPTLFQARSHDAADRTDPLVVYMVGADANMNYATSMMNAVQTIGAMITARLPRLTIVHLSESHYDWTDTKVRQCNLYPVLLGLLRSARIEAPNVTIGFVGGDAASWISNPAPMIESVFDTVETDESEIIYKQGDPFAPLLVHKPLDEPVQFVKPKKKTVWGGTAR